MPKITKLELIAGDIVSAIILVLIAQWIGDISGWFNMTPLDAFIAVSVCTILNYITDDKSCLTTTDEE